MSNEEFRRIMLIPAPRIVRNLEEEAK